MAQYLTEQQALIKAGVNQVALPSVFSWTSLEGGDVEAQTVNTLPGGMQPAVALGGPAKRNAVTVKRPYDTTTDNVIVQLENQVGKSGAWVSFTLLDAEGNPGAHTETITGVLKQVLRPNFDANGSAVAYLSLVIDPNAAATRS